jgi:hypothetical protein
MVLYGKLLGVGLSLVASRRYVCSGGHNGKGLHKLRLELHDLGGQHVIVTDGGITFEYEVFGLGYQYGELVSQVLAGVLSVGEVVGIFIAGAEGGIVSGVCGGGSKGLEGASMAGDDLHHNKGRRRWFGSYGCRFRYGGEFSGEDVV